MYKYIVLLHMEIIKENEKQGIPVEKTAKMVEDEPIITHCYACYYEIDISKFKNNELEPILQQPTKDIILIKRDDTLEVIYQGCEITHFLSKFITICFEYDIIPREQYLEHIYDNEEYEINEYTQDVIDTIINTHRNTINNLETF